MMNYFNAEILPVYNHLNRLLGIVKPEIHYEEDECIIPVTITLPSGSRQIYEDGVLLSCSHADTDFTPACCSARGSSGYIECGCGGMDSTFCNDCQSEVENE